MQNTVDFDQLLKSLPFESFKEASSMREDLQIDVEQIKDLYKQAYEFYDNEDYEQARLRFTELVTLDPWQSVHWMGLAAALHLEGNLESALKAYALTALLDEKNPYPHFYAAQCLSSLNQVDEAKKALNEALIRSSGHSEFLSLLQKVRIMQNQLDNKVTS